MIYVWIRQLYLTILAYLLNFYYQTMSYTLYIVIDSTNLKL
jgi:hypothetical protein